MEDKIETPVEEQAPIMILTINSMNGKISHIVGHLTITPDQYKDLWNLHPAEQGKILMYGKPRTTPRWELAFGKPHIFGKNIIPSVPIPEGPLSQLLAWINTRENLGKSETDPKIIFNQIIVNWYENGKHYIGPHSFVQDQYNKKCNVYLILYGASRKLIILNKQTKKTETITMNSADLVMMTAGFQEEYKHGIEADDSITESSILITILSLSESPISE